MAVVTKIAPRREGQEKGLYSMEERMHILIGQIAECDRILRQAREAEKRIADLRAELADISGQYLDLVREEGA